LAKFGLENCNPTILPMIKHLHLTKDMGGSLVDAHLYQCMVGKLNFLLQSRLDIGFALSNVNWFCMHPQKPSSRCCKTHLQVCGKVLLIWAYYTAKERIVFCLDFQMQIGSMTKMIGDQQSATLFFYTFLLGSTPVTWHSHK